MPDHPLSPPQDWSDAFARLGPETPPADGWARLSVQLQARDAAVVPAAVAPLPRRRGGARGWAWAAAVAAALPLAALWLLQRDDRAPTAPEAAPVASTVPAAQAPVAERRPAVAVAAANDAPAAASAGAETRPAADDRGRDGSAAARASAPAALVRQAPRTARRAATPPLIGEATRPAPSAADDAAAVASTAVNTATNTADDTGAAALARLQGESAQLETLVALARDERVGSGAATLMSAELDHGIAAIDAALSGPDLADAERVALWQQRVDALRALAGVEGSQRWYAARGERYEDALVRVD